MFVTKLSHSSELGFVKTEKNTGADIVLSGLDDSGLIKKPSEGKSVCYMFSGCSASL